jgi:serine/threonine protein kinase
MPESLANEPAAGEGDPLASEALARGTCLGRYELLSPIAVGGMARVWAARLHGQHGFTKLVAIKTILPHLASDPEFERMLIDEARIAAGVRHPNVVEIYELGEERGVVYIAMEWIYGDSLAHVLKPGATSTPLEPRLAARVVADVAAGLHAAHNLTDDDGRLLQVVHRDVSPHNLLVSLDGNVKVTDFGVAKALGASHKATSAGELKGKIAYMSPEQASGGAIDRRSDVFSLGCVLYEATTGQRPFRGDGEHRVIQEVIRASFTPPSRVTRGYPYELERIVLRAMAAQPIHRYQTMDQMRIALEEWLAKGGSIVTQSNVAHEVRERIGAELEKRREKLRLAVVAIQERGGSLEPTELNASRSSAPPPMARTPSGVKTSAPAARSSELARTSRPPPRSSSYPPPSELPLAAPLPIPPLPIVLEPMSARRPSGTHYAIAASLGILAAVALGASGVWVWRSIQPLPLAAAPAVAAPQVPSEPEPAIILPPAPPSTGTAAAVRATVAFKVIPEKAGLVVDGNVLPLSMREIPRPDPGAPQKITVHADGYEDETLTIDETAPASVDVWLNPVSAVRKGGAGHGAEAASKADAPKSEALPANPY